MKFEARISEAGKGFKYSWTVDKGTIFDGQGTTEITVDTTGLADQAVTAKVEIQGLSSECNRFGSASAKIEPLPNGHAFDEWLDLKRDDQRARLDMLFVALFNNPTHVAIITFKVKTGDRLDGANSRLQFVLKHAKFRKVDKTRLRFAFQPEEERSTRLDLMPLGATMPCSQCVIFKGEDLD